MMPRQQTRLRVTRKPSTPVDDQRTPAEIALSEDTSEDLDQFMDHVLSQVRQILGTAKWYDEVPVPLQELAYYVARQYNRVYAICLATAVVGDCVFSYDEDGSGIYKVRRTNPRDADWMPAAGMIVEKVTATECWVALRGVVNVSSGWLPGRPVFVGLDGKLTQDASTIQPSLGGKAWIQPMGTALSSDDISLNPSYAITGRTG